MERHALCKVSCTWLLVFGKHDGASCNECSQLGATYEDNLHPRVRSLVRARDIDGLGNNQGNLTNVHGVKADSKPQAQSTESEKEIPM